MEFSLKKIHDQASYIQYYLMEELSSSSSKWRMEILRRKKITRVFQEAKIQEAQSSTGPRWSKKAKK